MTATTAPFAGAGMAPPAELAPLAAGPASELRLFDDRDVPWIGDLLDVVERSIDEPWRVLLERIEHAPLAIGRRLVPSRARQQIVNTLRRLLGGRSERARIARKLRAKVLGHPAFDAATRELRIATTAAELGIEPHDVESLLWADLVRERPVTLPGGPPDPRMLAAHANVDRIQGAMRRAREVTLRLWDRPTVLVRMAARCGLVTSVVREASDGALRLHLSGPLALFHTTTVYGRALGAIVPLLADHSRFELAIHCDFRSGPHTLLVRPPVLLPPYAPRIRPAIAERLALDLEREGVSIEREPQPLVVGDRVLFPDLAIERGGRRWLVEVVGFSTAAYLADKLARYASAGVDVVLCVDTRRSKLAEAHPRVLPFERKIRVDMVLERVDQRFALE